MLQSSHLLLQMFVGNVVTFCPVLSQQWGPWINSSIPTASVAWAAIALCRACSSMTGTVHHSVKTATWIPWQFVPDVGRGSQTVCSKRWASVSMPSVSVVSPAPAHLKGHLSSQMTTTTHIVFRITTGVSLRSVWAATSPLFLLQAVRRQSEWWPLIKTSTLSVTVVRIVLARSP